MRLGVVHGLAGQHADEAAAALIRLTSDVDADMRNRATFGLGTLLDDVDTPQLRDALAARTDCRPAWQEDSRRGVGATAGRNPLRDWRI